MTILREFGIVKKLCDAAPEITGKKSAIESFRLKSKAIEANNLECEIVGKKKKKALDNHGKVW